MMPRGHRPRRAATGMIEACVVSRFPQFAVRYVPRYIYNLLLRSCTNAVS